MTNSRHPIISIAKLPPEEQPYARSISIGLWNLGQCYEEIQEALALHSEARSAVEHFYRPMGPPPMDTESRRHFLAIRDQMQNEGRRYSRRSKFAVQISAILIYKFEEQMTQIVKNLRNCATIREKVDQILRRKATKEFSRSFPHYRGIRHNIAHELYGTPEEMSVHEPKIECGEDAGKITFKNCIVDGAFWSSYRGETIHFELNQKTLDLLKEVRDLFWMSFAKCDPMWENKARNPDL